MKMKKLSGAAIMVLALTFLGGCASGKAYDEGMGADDHGGMEMGADDHAGDASYGEAGMASMANQTVEISIEDNVFSVAKVSAKEGDTIRFVVQNKDDFEHELVIGTVEAMAEHRAEMEAMMDKGMEMEDHGQPNELELPELASGELVWKFTQAGMFEFACNIPGHYEAGMHGMIMVGESHGS